MAPPKDVRTISQEAFDETVKENMEDLEMAPAEALEDAVQTLTLQGVDLSGIFILLRSNCSCRCFIAVVRVVVCCILCNILLNPFVFP